MTPEETLWTEYANSRQMETRNLLVEHYWPWTQKVAKQYKCRVPPMVLLDDLEGAAAIGLCHAVDAYQVGRGVKFPFFAYRRIWGAMQDHLRKCDWISRLDRQRATTGGRVMTMDSSALQWEDGGTIPFRWYSRESDHGTKDPVVEEVGRSDNRESLFKNTGLSGREREIIRQYYFDAKTMRETGESLNISEARVSQILKLALLQLRSDGRFVSQFRASL